MAQDYVMLARTKGFSESRVIIRDALRNALLPTLTLTGVQFTFLIGGTVIVERIFSYEGLGNLAIDAVINRDLPMIQGIIAGLRACCSSASISRSTSLRPAQSAAAPWLRTCSAAGAPISWRLRPLRSWLLIVVARCALRAAGRAARSAGAGLMLGTIAAGLAPGSEPGYLARHRRARP